MVSWKGVGSGNSRHPIFLKIEAIGRYKQTDHNVGDDDMDRFMRLHAVMGATSLSKSSIYRLISEGAFPRPVKLTGKASGWPESEIVKWIESRRVAA